MCGASQLRSAHRSCALASSGSALPLIAHASALVVVERDGAGRLLRFAGDQVGPGRGKGSAARSGCATRSAAATHALDFADVGLRRLPASRFPLPGDPRQALRRSYEGARRTPSRPNPLCTPTGPAVDSVCLRVGYLAALLACRRAVALQARTVGRRASGIQLTPLRRAARSVRQSFRATLPIEKRVRTCSAGLCAGPARKRKGRSRGAPAATRAGEPASARPIAGLANAAVQRRQPWTSGGYRAGEAAGDARHLRRGYEASTAAILSWPSPLVATAQASARGECEDHAADPRTGQAQVSRK